MYVPKLLPDSNNPCLLKGYTLSLTRLLPHVLVPSLTALRHAHTKSTHQEAVQEATAASRRSGWSRFSSFPFYSKSGWSWWPGPTSKSLRGTTVFPSIKSNNKEMIVIANINSSGCYKGSTYKSSCSQGKTAQLKEHT